MSLSVVHTRANLGIEAPLVTIEVHLSTGLPGFHLVGLPETTVKESRDRVRSAIINSGFEFPSNRITVNMAPADLPKGGGRFDLAIAIGILVASEQIPLKDTSEFEFVGELALSGELRGIQGALPMACAVKKSNRCLILPKTNANEAALVSSTKVLAAQSLWDVYLHLTGKQTLPNAEAKLTSDHSTHDIDLADIVEQQAAKRALILAAAGGHNILLYGPPGTGKSMLASRLVTIMPALPEDEALTVASIKSIVGEEVSTDNWQTRPYRTPHHSSSASAIVGGGSYPMPGEITLAHKGILFLDELPEFGRHVLDVLREPLETGEIHLSRAKHKVTYPADFQLVAAMNPSPTGDHTDRRANADQILRYLNRLSGPLLDRIDMQINVPKVDIKKSINAACQTNDVERLTSKQARQGVQKAVDIQLARQAKLNAALNTQELKLYCRLDDTCMQFLSNAAEKLGLSMRSFHRIIKVARTIADIANVKDIQQNHIAEALSYRSFDKLLHQLANN
ncbi:YifB family Mg chelatase-like AAA ATPase [Agaribacter flavus]|uniref:YifB family Mg chelatase-like AAA ATPase n=1 Tax=Agaribacter flavus TaxID=1902781 RepID=A0ABV7FTH1_9ALTE